jgi:hypothetical protein
VKASAEVLSLSPLVTQIWIIIIVVVIIVAERVSAVVDGGFPAISIHLASPLNPTPLRCAELHFVRCGEGGILIDHCG